MRVPALSIIVVTYNSAHVILDCLAAVAHIEDCEVVVYDNASSDDTVEVVRLKFPMVAVIEGVDNAGFAKGVNRAVAASSAPRVMLLNPDAVIEEAAVRRLMTSLDHRPSAVIAPLVVHPQGLVKVASAGYFPTPAAMGAHYSGLSRLPGVRGHYVLLNDVSDDRITEVDWVSGACLMTTRTTWDALGGLDERWFMYAEDIDFCWRVRQHGGSVWMDSAATATHLVGASDGTRSGAVNSLWVENLYDFYALRMARGPLATVRWGLVVSAGLLVRSIVFSLQRRPSAAREFRAHSRAVLRCMRTAGRAVDG